MFYILQGGIIILRLAKNAPKHYKEPIWPYCSKIKED
jgi:hypothetical protein